MPVNDTRFWDDIMAFAKTEDEPELPGDRRRCDLAGELKCANPAGVDTKLKPLIEAGTIKRLKVKSDDKYTRVVYRRVTETETSATAHPDSHTHTGLADIEDA